MVLKEHFQGHCCVCHSMCLTEVCFAVIQELGFHGPGIHYCHPGCSIILCFKYVGKPTCGVWFDNLFGECKALLVVLHCFEMWISCCLCLFFVAFTATMRLLRNAFWQATAVCLISLNLAWMHCRLLWIVCQWKKLSILSVISLSQLNKEDPH